MLQFKPSQRFRGVSLIEAVVALAVMAVGMLAVVGVQATLRANADSSRQRAEAVRLAQAAIEDWRAFTFLNAAAARPGTSFAEVTTDVVGVPSPGVNATYLVTRRVPPQITPSLKTVVVTVAWRDRTNQDFAVTLSSAIAGISPDLAGSLALPQNSGLARQALSRAPNIPREAKNLGDGTSVFVPPQPSTAPVVAWVFDNTTGLITRSCTVSASSTSSSLTVADVTVAACIPGSAAQLLSGFVRFAKEGSPPNAAGLETLEPTLSQLLTSSRNLDVELTLTSSGHTLPPVCYDNSPSTEALALGQAAVVYYCAIPMNTAATWSGRSRLVPQAFLSGTPWVVADSGVGKFKVCRYTALDNDGTSTSKNIDHPLDYRAAGSIPRAALPLQNFLVISAEHNCPADTPTAGDPINSNTRLHQSGVAPYV